MAKTPTSPRKATVKSSVIKLPGLAATIDDARQAAEATDKGPADATTFSDLLKRLTAVHGSFPPVYEQHFVSPFIATLQRSGMVMTWMTSLV